VAWCGVAWCGVAWRGVDFSLFMGRSGLTVTGLSRVPSTSIKELLRSESPPMVTPLDTSARPRWRGRGGEGRESLSNSTRNDGSRYQNLARRNVAIPLGSVGHNASTRCGRHNLQ
jgi:hypothetical protein